LRKKKVRKEEATVVDNAEGPVDRMDAFEEGSAHADPERSMQNRQLSQRIESALVELTPRERMVFELRHYQGLRLRAIGEMLGTSEEAAKNCLFRATQKMRAVLGDFV
jgi:RNA polymerase sigma-70 factor (ECF subfamily)